MKLIPAWMEDTDEGTWIGHWLQGLAGFWLGYLPVRHLLDLPLAAAVSAGILSGFLVVAAVFWHREGDNLREAAKTMGWRMAIRKKLLDGWMDWTMPMLGVFADINLVLGGPGAFAGALLGTAAFFGIVVMWKRRKS